MSLPAKEERKVDLFLNNSKLVFAPLFQKCRARVQAKNGIGEQVVE
jgi:hypothetical protein